jgi:D-alanine-D-alanine ligase
VTVLVAIIHNALPANASPSDRDVLDQVQVVRKALEKRAHHVEVRTCSLDLETSRQELLRLRPDVVFNLVESLGGFDRLQHLATALWDVMGLPYTGNPTEALLLTNHKLLAKQMLMQSGLPTPAWLGARSGDCSLSAFPPDGRFIIKAIGEHASVGLDDEALVRADGPADLKAQLLRRTESLGHECFAERYIEGREFNLSLLAGPDGPDVLPPAEIDFSTFPAGKPRIVGYRAKWEVAAFEFENTPRTFDFAVAEQPLLERLGQLARACWPLFGLRGYVRIDFRVDADGSPWILEINTNPCLSPDGGFAAALARAEIGFDQAISRIVADALRASGKGGVLDGIPDAR